MRGRALFNLTRRTAWNNACTDSGRLHRSHVHHWNPCHGREVLQLDSADGLPGRAAHAEMTWQGSAPSWGRQCRRQTTWLSGRHETSTTANRIRVRPSAHRAARPHPSELDVTPVAGSSPQFTAPLCCAWHAFQWIAGRPQWGGLTGAILQDVEPVWPLAALWREHITKYAPLQ